ncbi:hypothetical protein MSG28_004552 [Choristoneura fumiferana]|uniref:Uncharacterized protein n=1 Tax=Choristoneura fumiferana TaxID=7141 RepID=A0ACC0K6I6_CHOFU|nr:hypothetical protein MSG28_004552 [Choristoneura fumiferana]
MSKIVFKINGKQYEVDGNYGPDVSLNEFIRTVADLRGTKAMCHEGGCGACVVAIRAAAPPTNEMRTFAVNSCLVSVLSCHGWEVTTVEGIGNRTIGYHDIQSRLAKFNGTQCGYCTPGWVMNMYSLSKSKNDNLTMSEIENSFAGNICRCTGYRPIADAFKTFATDVDKKLLSKLCDLEDLSILKSCGVSCAKKCPHKKNNDQNLSKKENDDDWCELTKSDNNMIQINCKNNKWSKAFTLEDVFKAMKDDHDYKLIAGNTGQDIFNIVELKGYILDVNLILGAGMPLTEMMELFLELSKKNEDFSYLQQFYDHMDLVAHIPVRNIGTIGGNLCLKHVNNQFQSDLFLLFETVGAMVTVAEALDKKVAMSLPDFLSSDLKGKVLLNVRLPPLSHCCNIMPRSQNAHAVVNAGFLLRFHRNSQLLENVSIVYGSIAPNFIHASKTEAALVGKNPFTNETLQLAVNTLFEEIHPEEAPPEPSAAYRRMLAVALYYKYRSGGDAIKRIISQGSQTFDTDKSVWPLNQPVPKLEALVQCSGEATFANDLPKQENEVFAAFVTANVVAGSVIDNFDASEALKVPGVIAFYSAKDIPGENCFTPANVPFMTAREEILCSGKVEFNGQPAGIIVANREKIANKAAKLVKINYAGINNNKPLLTIDDVLKSPEKNKRVVLSREVEPTEIGNDVRCIIQGEFKIESQYHYTMEPQTTVVKPTEDGIEVYSATQWLDLTNIAIAQCLKVPVNSVNVIVRRVGGAYGSKISRAAQIACACALVSHFLGTTCRFILPLQTNMRSVGKRLPTTCNFEAGVNLEGGIQHMKLSFYQDCGHIFNEVIAPITVEHVRNCYNAKRWKIEANSVATDTASNTWCRAPASTEGVAIIEHIMERIAFNLNKDSLQIRLANMRKGNAIPEMFDQLKRDSNFDQRQEEVKKFNEENRWRKRALNLLPIEVDVFYLGNYNAVISIYHGDGSVVVTHGGIEMGQGINTKAAQVCAYILGIPLEKVSVKPSTSFTSPNAIVTGGSIGSECVAFAVKKASEILMERFKPIKDKMEKYSWEELINQAYAANVDLQASYMMSPKDNIKPYNVQAVCALEVEVDILTGNHDVRRVDLLEDTGRSLSPEIDVAQIEGAFVMGLGYWTSEKLLQHQKKLEMSKILFKINGKQYEADGKYGPDVSLNEFIRTVADLRGTKAMCHEGGCGACVVAIRAAAPPTNEMRTFAVNSCLVSILSCHGWEITTVEGIGNRTMGYHDIQTRLAKFNGTQCGYCTPGWIMNMYSLYNAKNGKLTTKEIENSFAGNLCRCTGYRPIADAFKTFASDADCNLVDKLTDLEDLGMFKPCGVNCTKKCPHKNKENDILLGKLNLNQDKDTPEDDWCVVEDSDNKLTVLEYGAQKWYKAFTLEHVFKIMAMCKEYKLIAGNTGQGVYHVESYPSNVIDIFSVAEIKGYVIDIMPRSQNAHAVVNAGFMFKFKRDTTIIEKVSMIFGSISASFIHASKTEALLIGKDLFTNETLQIAAKSLFDEILPEEAPPEPSAAYRRMLAVSLYYKAILYLCPEDKLDPKHRSGGTAIKRNTSKGTQMFDTDKSVWPLNQPVPKIEALVQCSGEANFANDLPSKVGEVYGAFVCADANSGSIISGFDATEAMKITGVVAFYTAQNIPGDNVFTPLNVPLIQATEEILCSKEVKFYGQPAAIIVANREKIANRAAKLVKVKYASINKNRPLLTPQDVLKSPERSKRVTNNKTVEPVDVGHDVKLVLKGELNLETQYHYYMEPQTCVVKPTEDGIEVYSATQWLDLTNVAVAQCLKVPANSVNVIVRRVGGSYGGKITRSVQIACAAAIVSHLQGKTCRFVVPLQTNIKIAGKRIPTHSNFEVGVNNEGEIQYLRNIFYQDNGCAPNETIGHLTLNHFLNCYDTKRWYIEANTSTEGVAMIENIIEIIAHNLGKDPMEIRAKNMAKGNNPIPELIDQLKQDSNYEARLKEIVGFNGNNRWRKRAMKIIPMTYELFYFGNYNSIVSVLHGDGSVVITHGGIEMGQGINTKVAQVAAYILGVSLDKVSIKPSTSFISPNTMTTGASIGSECVVFATMKACEILIKRFEPIREKMGKPSWEELVEKVFKAGIDLQASHMFSNNDGVKPYFIYGVVALELEVDILTGNHDVRRVDLLEDTGRSLSPEIDIGQIEGAFVMGLGYFTSEKTIYDPESGRLLTDRTWTYKPPGIKDIPADFRVYFKRNAGNPYGVLQSKADGKYGPDVSLNEFIRTVADLRGTKAMCHEGGCGACVVAIRAAAPPTNEMRTFAVNSIMPRSQNAHAVVNAGFMFKFKRDTTIIEKVSLIFGSISASFIHASKTEALLIGKDLFTNETLQIAAKSLFDEILPEEAPPEPSAAYRRMLAVSLYYKAILYLCPEDKLDPKHRSGGTAIKRNTSKGTQMFDTDKSVWPLNQPVPKIEALVQCSGEANFANDLPSKVGEVYGAFVCADANSGSIISGFDATEAMKITGVVAFYTAQNIPGDNVFTPLNVPLIQATEEILCSKEVKFYGQPAAIIVANREKIANRAAKLVKVKYASINKNRPLLTPQDVLKSPERSKRVTNNKTVEPVDVGHDVKLVLKGELNLETQYHYYMEPQTCVVKPTEDDFRKKINSFTIILNARDFHIPITNFYAFLASTEGVAMIENIIEIIAHNLGKDPMEIRAKNMAKGNNPIPELIDQLKQDSNYEARLKEIVGFNGNNRWRKRAMKIIPMTYELFYFGNYNSIVSVLHGDGSVVITHGGIEMGQGINTKVAQVAAYILGVSLDKVSIKPSTSFISPNTMTTGASIGSECVVFATMKACEILMKRFEPIREKMGKPSWEELVEKVFKAGIDLQASHMFSNNDGVKPYFIYGVVALELEVDILTGNHDVRRVDLLEDTGRSLSPEIDIGQEMALSKKTDVRQMWEKIPFALDFKIYLFNYTNAAEVQKGAIPIVKEIGPYYFEEWKEKVEVEENDEDDTINYKKLDVFLFKPEQSGPGLTGEEIITMPNPFMVGMATVVHRDKPAMLNMINKAFAGIFDNPEDIFFRVKALDILFRGIIINCARTEFAPKAVCTALKKEAVNGSFKPWYQKKTSYRGIKTNRYIANIGDFANDPELQCFCDTPDTCPPKGLMDLTKCLGAPMFVSMPHFLDCDPSVQKNVKGLTPDANEHGIEIDFEPISGTPMEARQRIQFNMRLLKTDKLELFKDLPDTIAPLFWIEEGLALNKTFVNMLKHQLFWPKRAVGVLKWLLVSFGILGALGGAVFHFKGRVKAGI